MKRPKITRIDLLHNVVQAVLKLTRAAKEVMFGWSAVPTSNQETLIKAITEPESSM